MALEGEFFILKMSQKLAVIKSNRTKENKHFFLIKY